MNKLICIAMVGLFGATAMAAIPGEAIASVGEEETDGATDDDVDRAIEETRRRIRRYGSVDEARQQQRHSEETIAPEEAVDEAVERARGDSGGRHHSERAVESVERAYDAALIRTDIELDNEHDESESLLDDERVRNGIDGERLERLRAFFDRFAGEEVADEEDSTPLVRLREVGNQIAGSTSSTLRLQPYVPDPQWEEAMALLSEDDCEDALELASQVLGPPELHVDGEPAIAYAYARMQMCGGERRSGRETMRQLAELATPVGRLANRELGRASTPEIDDGSYEVSGHIRRARQLAERDVDAALEQLAEFRRGLDSSWYSHRVRLAEAEILEEAGRVDEAVMAYRGIYRQTAGWRSSDSISSRIERAEDRLDRTIITFADRLDRMRALIRRGRFRKARQVSIENADIRDVEGAEIRGWTRYRRALQNERRRHRERAVEQFEEAADLVEDPVVLPRVYFGWARALRRTDSNQEAIELYDRICREYPGGRLCARSLYEAGRLLQYQNDHREARERFAQLVGLYPFSDRVPDALWRYSLSAHLVGDYAQAIGPLEMLVEHYGEMQDASELTIGLKARYWIGVNYLEDGQRERARRWLQETIDEGPLTWYGRLAVSRLDEAGMPSRVSMPTAQLSQSEIENLATLRVPDNPRLSVAAEMARLGMYDAALSEVQEQLDVHPAPEGATQLRAALHLAVEEPNYTHWVMKSVIDESGPTHSTLRDWGLAFPLNYFELARRYGERFEVSPFLVQAIMRQESGFRPNISSPAGASGLMQLMPGTARYTSRVFFEERSLSRSDIVDEETNVRLGTMYVRIHEAHASDRTPLALAGYNAGPAPLQRWFERYEDRDLDAWVESITYRETRGYVRKVMTSYITYQGLYGDGDLPDIGLDMPDELREWGEVPEVDDIEPVSMLIQ